MTYHRGALGERLSGSDVPIGVYAREGYLVMHGAT